MELWKLLGVDGWMDGWMDGQMAECFVKFRDVRWTFE